MLVRVCRDGVHEFEANSALIRNIVAQSTVCSDCESIALALIRDPKLHEFALSDGQAGVVGQIFHLFGHWPELDISD